VVLLAKKNDPRGDQVPAVETPLTTAMLRSKLPRIDILIDKTLSTSTSASLELYGLGGEPSKTKLTVNTNLPRGEQQIDTINSAISARVSTPSIGDKELAEDCKIIQSWSA
jgi:hypothetical protein